MGLPFLIRCPIPKTEQNFHHPHALFQIIWRGGGGCQALLGNQLFCSLSPHPRKQPGHHHRSLEAALRVPSNSFFFLFFLTTATFVPLRSGSPLLFPQSC